MHRCKKQTRKISNLDKIRQKDYLETNTYKKYLAKPEKYIYDLCQTTLNIKWYTNHEIKMSAKVSAHVNSAKTIQYIIHFTWRNIPQNKTTQYLFSSRKTAFGHEEYKPDNIEDCLALKIPELKIVQLENVPLNTVQLKVIQFLFLPLKLFPLKCCHRKF